MSEVITRFQKLSADFDRRVQAVTDWSATAPCEGWTARDVVGHVTNNVRGIAAGPAAVPFGAEDDPKTAFTEAVDAAVAAMNQPGALERELPGPFGPMPLEQIVGRLICNDILIHTWDLARSAGLDEQLDADAVHHAFDGLRPLDAMLRRPGVFGPKLDAPAGADEQTEFLMFLGRQV